MSRSRNWVFTLNNYTTEDVEELYEQGERNTFVFLCFGKEVGLGTFENGILVKPGTPHLQGYLEFRYATTLSNIKKQTKALARAHFEPRRGTKLDAVVYCAKELIHPICFNKRKKEWDEDTDINKKPFVPPKEVDVLNFGKFNIKDWRDTINDPYEKVYFEAGDWEHGLKPGSRSDINVVKEMIKENKKMSDICDVANSYQSVRFAELIIKYKESTRTWMTEVIWLYGEPGCGKSHLAREMCESEPWVWLDTYQWFDGYQRDECAIFDDFFFDYKKDSWKRLLKLFDKYKMKVPTKGGFVDWCPRKVIITTTKTPQEVFEDWCEGHNEDILQLTRRLVEVKKVDHWESAQHRGQ